MDKELNNIALSEYYQMELERRNHPINQFFRFIEDKEYQKEWEKRYLEQLNQNKDENTRS